MSQAGGTVTGGGGGGGDVTQINSQDGNAIAAAGVIILNAYDSTENNDNGIVTKAGVAGGDPPGTGAANEVDIYITNRITGTVTTVTDTSTPIITFNLGTTPATYYIYGNVQAFQPTAPPGTAGGGFSFSGAYLATPAFGAVELGTEFHDDFKSPAFNNVDLEVIVSGNNVILQVIGLNLVPINWNAMLEYRRVL